MHNESRIYDGFRVFTQSSNVLTWFCLFSPCSFTLARAQRRQEYRSDNHSWSPAHRRTRQFQPLEPWMDYSSVLHHISHPCFSPVPGSAPIARPLSCPVHSPQTSSDSLVLSSLVNLSISPPMFNVTSSPVFRSVCTP